jgi:hypothetical protein
MYMKRAGEEDVQTSKYVHTERTQQISCILVSRTYMDFGFV